MAGLVRDVQGQAAEERGEMIDQSVYEDAIRRAARLLTIATFDDPADLADVEFIFGVADEIEEEVSND